MNKVSDVLEQLHLNGFKSKVNVSFSHGHYTLKTVTENHELLSALKLRHQVFFEEMIGKPLPSGVDVDRFDALCDHLIIRDDHSGEVVGTYRLNCSLFTEEFYSSQEFELDSILSKPGIKLELGRACIHRDFRTGAVMSLLWRGVAAYMVTVDAVVLLGCASVKTENPQEASLLYQYFNQSGLLISENRTPPTSGFKMPGFEHLQRSLSAEEEEMCKQWIPALCKAYLKAGALLGGEPAYDPEFRCIDFLTVLDRQRLSPRLWKRYEP